MSISQITKQIKSYALSKASIDKVGIASIDRFDGAPYGYHPTDFLPGCKSVIVVCIRVPDGAVESCYRAFEDEQRQIHGIYGAFGYVGAPNYRLMFANYRIAQFVEKTTGEIACPCPAGPTHGMKTMSMRHVAAAAGLGEFGWNSLMLTPEFGPRNRFGAVLTTAELEPDPLYNGPKLCDPAKCRVCEKMCPTGAIPPYAEGQERVVEMGDRTFKYCGINWSKCRIACHGMYAPNNTSGGDLIDPENKNPFVYEVDEAVKYYAEKPISDYFQHNPTWRCGNCLTYCPAGNWKDRFQDTGLSKVDTRRFIDGDSDAQ